MNCGILQRLYVKANGEIPCYDDFGERVTLGWAEDERTWSIEKVLSNKRYTHLRNSLSNGVAPWEGVCENCALLRPNEPFDDRLARRRIEILQIEVSLLCHLQCPACSRPQQIVKQGMPYMMDTAVFERLLQSLAESGYSIDCIEYCGQGEPLSHPEFKEFVRIARRLYPDSRQRLITNANYDYAKVIGDAHIDEIYVSIDGALQSSYERYRIQGHIDRAFEFVRQARRVSPDRRPKVIWKYILLEYNDSDAEVRLAHHLAEELQVDMLLFVVTRTDFRSRRYTVDNLHEVLLLAPQATVLPTPGMHRDGCQFGRLAALAPAIDFHNPGQRFFFNIDQIFSIDRKVLCVQGWAVDKRAGEAARIDLRINGREVGKAALGFTREDVASALPGTAVSTAGFLCWGKSPDDLSTLLMVELELHARDGEVETYAIPYRQLGQPDALTADEVDVLCEYYPIERIYGLTTTTEGGPAAVAGGEIVAMNNLGVDDSGIVAHIDDLRLRGDGIVHIAGWAFTKTSERITHIAFLAGEDEIGKARLKLPRQDVKVAYPYYQSKDAGFELLGRVRRRAADDGGLRMRITLDDDSTKEFALAPGGGR